MRVRPSRPGLIVGYPRRARSLAAGGEEVPRSSYWIRRLNKGDVVLVEPDQSKPVPPEPTRAAPEPEPEPEHRPTPEPTRPIRKKARAKRADADDPRK